VMLIVHAVVEARVVTQVSLSEKSPAAVTLLMVKSLVPLLVKVTICAPLVVLTTWLPNVRFGDKRLTPGTFPVPPSAITCVPALSAMVTAPLRVPATAGVKVTPTVHVPPGPNGPELTQFPDATKSPLALTVAISNVPVPVLVTVTLWEALVVATTWLPKFSVEELRLTTGAVPVPLSARASWPLLLPTV